MEILIAKKYFESTYNSTLIRCVKKYQLFNKVGIVTEDGNQKNFLLSKECNTADEILHELRNEIGIKLIE